MNIHLFLGWKILNGLENGTIDLAIPDFLTFASKPYRALAISSSVSLSEYEDIPTFAQIGLEIDSYALVFGITVSPQTSESLRQEISNAFSNITMNPNFTSQINNLGASVLIGYNYGSSNLNNFINHEISILEQASWTCWIINTTTNHSHYQTKHTCDYSWSYRSNFCDISVNSNYCCSLFESEE